MTLPDVAAPDWLPGADWPGAVSGPHRRSRSLELLIPEAVAIGHGESPRDKRQGVACMIDHGLSEWHCLCLVGTAYSVRWSMHGRTAADSKSAAIRQAPQLPQAPHSDYRASPLLECVDHGRY